MIKWFKKKKEIVGRTLYEGFVKRMDVRYGSFLWLKDRDTGKEFYSDVMIERIVIDLPDGVLSKRIETRTKDGLVKLRLRTILEDLGDKEGYYKFIYFKKPMHVKVFGVPGKNIELTFSEGGIKDGFREEVKEEAGEQG